MKQTTVPPDEPGLAAIVVEPVASFINDEPTSTDLLGRAALAKNLAQLIVDAQSGESFRLGLYGGWGEGKTSLMHMMRGHLLTAGVRTTLVFPWMSNTADDLTANVLEAIATAAGATKPIADAKVEKLAAATGKAWNELSKSDWKLQILDSVVGGVIRSAKDKLESYQKEHVFEAIQAFLKSNKLVVFVDDVDRTEPGLVPKLLLNLREALSLPNLFYVIGLSPTVVQDALIQAHPGYKDPFRFLEKIVEYPVFIPPLKLEQIRRFANCLAAPNTGIAADVLESIASLLPTNPRQLKLFLRILALLSSQFARFDRDEIALPAVYLAQLLLLEFPHEARELAKRDEDVKWIEKYQVRELMDSSKPTKAERPPPAAAELLTDEIRRERFLVLCAAIGQRLSLTSSYGVREMLRIIESPPVLTWKEFLEHVQIAKRATAEQLVSDVTTWAAQIAESADERRRTFFRRSLEYRKMLWDNVIEIDVQKEAAEVLSDFDLATELLRVQLDEMGGFRDSVLTVGDWQSLYDHLAELSRFTKPSDTYAQRRLAERQLMRRVLDDSPVELRGEVLRAQRSNFTPQITEPSTLFRGTIKEVVAECDEAVAEDLLSRFSSADGVDILWEDRSPVRAVAFNPASRFHSKSVRARFREVLLTARENAVVQKNALTYLRAIVYGAASGGSFPVKECRELLSKHAFVESVWRAATVHRLNLRTMGSLREQRDALIDQLKVPEKRLPRPKWWKQLEKDLHA